MKMHCTLQLCFALLLTALGRVSEATESKVDVVSTVESSEQEFKCGWNCEYMESDVSHNVNWAFRTGELLLRLELQYEERVNPNCVNETSEVSRKVGSTRWQIWSVNRKTPSIASKALRKFSDLSLRTFNMSFRIFKANCTFNFTQTKSNNSQEHLKELSPREYFKGIIRLTVAPMGNICKNEKEQNDLHGNETCIMITEYTQDPFSSLTEIIGFLFMIVFTFFGPAVVCVFCASEVTHQGIRQITVEGPSPVGFRRLIGNYFFSVENTFWHRMRKFIMRVILLPIPFLVPAIYFYYLLHQNALSQPTSAKTATLPFSPFRMVCYGCYVIQAFFFHLIRGKPNPPFSLVYCPKSFSKDESCDLIFSRRELPERMLSRFRVAWFVFRKVGKIMGDNVRFMFVYLYQNLKDFFYSCTSPTAIYSLYLKVKRCLMIRNLPDFFLSSLLLFWFGFLWASYYFVTGYGIFETIIKGLIICIVYLIFSISFPAGILCNYKPFKVTDPTDPTDLMPCFLKEIALFYFSSIIIILDICLSCLAVIGVAIVLKSAAIGIIILLHLTIAFVLCEENLPFVSCCVLVCVYLWSNYRSFTQKYKDLAVKLYERHRQQIVPHHNSTKDDVKRIPKELFDLACEQMMPVGKSICEVLLKALLSMIFVSFIYLSLTKFFNSSHLIRAFVLFVVGSFPKFVSMYVYRGQRDTKAVVIEDKVRHIVQEYITSARSHIWLRIFPSEPPEDENNRNNTGSFLPFLTTPCMLRFWVLYILS